MTMNSLSGRPRVGGRLARLAMRFSTIRELTAFFAGTGRWWLLPMVAVLLLTGALLVVVQIIEYAAPFVYTVF
jgi:hypothetical protein